MLYACNLHNIIRQLYLIKKGEKGLLVQFDHHNVIKTSPSHGSRRKINHDSKQQSQQSFKCLFILE